MSDIANSATAETPAEADFLAVASAPSRSAAIVYGAMANAIGLAMLNDVAAQQQASISRQQAVTMACAGLISLCFAGDADGSPEGPPAEAQVAKGPDARETAPAPPAAAAAAREAAQPVPPIEPSSSSGDLADIINQMQEATLNPQVVLTSGSGKAYQLVAQSAALTIMDAGDLMRAAATLALFIKAMALARMAITGDRKGAEVAADAQMMLEEAAENYAAICAAATAAVNEFPSG